MIGDRACNTMQAALRAKEREIEQCQALAIDRSPVEAPKAYTSVSPQALQVTQSGPNQMAGTDTNTITSCDSSIMSRCVHALAQSAEERNVLKQGLEDMASACSCYHTQLQIAVDQRNMLYRDYTAMASQMRARCLAHESRNDKLLNEVTAANAKLAVLEAQLCNATHMGELESTPVHAVVLRYKLDRVWWIWRGVLLVCAAYMVSAVTKPVARSCRQGTT